MSSALSGVKRWFNSPFGLVPSNGERPTGLKLYTEAEELFPYTRPSFLGLSKEASKASADHEIRPILVAHQELPLNAGYSETINAGKTYLVNEDQAFAENYCLNVIKIDKEKGQETITKLPYQCFGIFDGHAGHGAALAAVNQLQDIIHEKLHDIQEVVISNDEDCRKQTLLKEAVAPSINFYTIVTGVLEQAFVEMDARIKKDKRSHAINGGCTAVVSLFIKNKLFVANAGDSRAVICKDWKPIPMSNDHTPQTERKRLQFLASLRPGFLGPEFTRFEFQQKPRRKHIGKKLFCRDRNMSGWALKVITEEDVNQTQMICGSGKSARLLETISTTRGFGDFDLKASYTGVPIKPFLTPEPEVKIFDLSSKTLTADDVLIMATDGLWERVTNEKACMVIQDTFRQCGTGDNKRYCVAAQNLVMAARGRNTARGWRRVVSSEENFNEAELKSTEAASYDDISVFVIPLGNCQEKPDVVQYPISSGCDEVSEQLCKTLDREKTNDSTSLDNKSNTFRP